MNKVFLILLTVVLTTGCSSTVKVVDISAKSPEATAKQQGNSSTPSGGTTGTPSGGTTGTPSGGTTGTPSGGTTGTPSGGTTGTPSGSTTGTPSGGTTGTPSGSTQSQSTNSSSPKASTEIEGVPFRVPNVYTVRVFQKKADGSYEKVERQFVKVLPDPDKLYALNVNSELLSKSVLDVKFHANGTLDLVELSGVEFRGDEALTALGTQATAVYEAIGNRELTALQAQTAAVNAQKGLLDAEAALETATDKPADDLDSALILALEALGAANAAYDALEDLLNQDPPPTATQVRAGERALLLARVKANQAYRKADLPEPFPGVAFP